ncbi:disulfide bond formation protein DsbB [Thalassotalea sp. HSM 43]|uniref:disulfide bond formation protein DsbB n=1 Tax=Thalassotalea sp. HSM 43 TaxID=2552945 RepID=UPI001081C454|nr:disulfide bond formation protein DsbB [Thalassotalea sp. HSM 43]QBY05556.1 disulfide bond formation protein DsbB [Thalassotalea sp. HSM 43]
MLKKLNDFVLNPLSWWLLALSALGLELSALYFQYGMKLEPCIMCIYQRVAILAIMVAGVIGAVGNKYTLLRLIGFAIWAVGAIWGLALAVEHVEIQANAGSLFYTCDLVPNFPSWMPLHEWIPSLFEATGDCGEISWQFLGYSMPQWMVVVYGVYTVLFAIFFISRVSQLFKK